MASITGSSASMTAVSCPFKHNQVRFSIVNSVSLSFNGKSFPSLSLRSAPSRFRVCCAKFNTMNGEMWPCIVLAGPGKSIGLSAVLSGLVLVGRAAFVFPLSFIYNLTMKSPSEKIDFKQQVTIWMAGLMRGAVSMALAYNQFTTSSYTKVHGNALMITSTITIILFSTVLFGLMTKPLVRILLPSPKNLSGMLSSEPCTPKSFTVPLLGNGHDSEANQKSPEGPPRPTSLRMLLSTPSHTVHYYW